MKKITSPSLGYLDDRYVNVAGDTMTGHLAMGKTTTQGLQAWVRFFSNNKAAGDIQFVPSVALGHGVFSIRQTEKTLQIKHSFMPSNEAFLYFKQTGAQDDCHIEVFGTDAQIAPNDTDLKPKLGNGSGRWNTFMSGMATHTQTVTAASDTLVTTDCVVLCDCTSNAITINLPLANISGTGAAGKTYHIKKIDSTSNTVTIDGNGSETIDGDLTKVITSQWDSLMIVSDGSNWYII